MGNLAVILPIALLVLAFMLKLSIDKPIDIPNSIKAVCELPIDMIFLAISFIIAYTISHKENAGQGLFYFIMYIVVAIVLIIVWQKSLKLIEAKKKVWILLLFINMTLSIITLTLSIQVFANDIEAKQSSNNIETQNGN